MPVIQTYRESTLPQGQLNVQASAASFGGQVGAAIGNVAETGQYVYNKMYEQQKRAEEDSARIWAYNKSSEAFVALKQQLNSDVNALDPNAPDFQDKVGKITDNFNQQINNTTSDLMASAPNDFAKRILAQHTAVNSKQLMNLAIGEQSRIMGDFTAKQVSDGIKIDQDEIAADYSDANYNRILSNRREMIGSLNNVNPTDKIKWWDDIKRKLSQTKIDVHATSAPSDFLSKVNPQGGRLTPAGTTKGAVPGAMTIENFRADKVKPYTQAQIESRINAVNAPSKYDDIFKAAGAEYGVDWKELKLRSVVESSLNPSAVSSQGATGIMQFMPATAKQLGIDPTDPKASIFAAAKLLSSYAGKAGGDMSKVDMMYYGGEGGTQWGPNTKQYAANLSALRSALGGEVVAPNVALPQIASLTDNDIAASKPNIAGWENLTWPEKVASVRKAEGILGAQVATERGEISRSIADIKATYLDGKEFADINNPRYSAANLIKVFGQDQGSRLYGEIDYARKVGGFISGMARMPREQALGYLRSMAPAAGDQYAAKDPMFDHAVTAFQRLDKLRNEDYAQWALNTPNVANNIKPIDLSSPDKFRESLVPRISMAITGRQDYQADAKLLSKGEVEYLAATLGKLSVADQVTYLSAMRKATQGNDGWFLETAKQIAPHNTMLAQAAYFAGKTGTVDYDGQPINGQKLAQMLLEGTRILQGKDLGDNEKVSKAFKLDEAAFSNRFFTHAQKAFAGPDAARSADLANTTYQAVKNVAVADAVRRGETTPSNRTIERAFNAVTGGVSKVYDANLIRPWGMSDDNFTAKFKSAATDTFKQLGMKGNNANPAYYTYANADDGKYYVMVNPYMPLTANGKNVIISIGTE